MALDRYKERYNALPDSEKNDIVAELKDATDDLAKRSLLYDFEIGNKTLETIYKEGSDAEDIVDLYLCNKYINSIADATGDDSVSKAEYLDILADMDMDDDMAWDIYFSKYSDKTAIQARENGVDAKVFMKASATTNGLKGDVDAKGDSIAYSKMIKVVEALDELNISDGDKEVLFKLDNTGKTYQSMSWQQIRNYVNNKYQKAYRKSAK